MTDEQINIAIAEACGWKWNYGDASITTKSSPAMYWGKEPINPLELVAYRQLPDYCNDLNAMHEAEKYIMDECSILYKKELEKVSCIWHSTAKQKSIAFLKAIWKWDE